MTGDPLPLSRLRARIAAPRGQEKLESLLAADDPAAAVADLSATDLHQLVHEVGFSDAIELIALVTPEQIRGCVDLDAWNRDHIQVEAVNPWFAALAEIGYQKFGQVWQVLDTELTALFLARNVLVFDLSLGEEPDDADDRPVVMTPDTYFAIKLISDDRDTVRLVHRIIDHLYRADPTGAIARHTLMAVRSEPVSELEEMSYRWRSGRMSDLGYVDFYQAVEVFRPLDPKSVRIGEGTEDRFGRVEDPTEVPGLLPAPVAERVVGTSFLARALDRIDQRTSPDESARLENAFMVLLNKVLSAARVSPSDEQAQLIGAEHAAAAVSLGLETVTGGDLSRAAAALHSISLTRLHRAGYTVTVRLARLARALAQRAATAAEPVPSMLAELLRRRPFFPRVLDDPPGDGARPFVTVADVRRVADELSTLALRVAIAETLGVDLIALAHTPEPRPELDDYVRTALIRAMLGDRLAPTPLSTADLHRFAQSCTADRTTDRITGRAADQTTDQVTREPGGPSLNRLAQDRANQAVRELVHRARVDAAHHLVPQLVTDWLTRLGELGQRILTTRDPLDPRFVDGVVLAAERH
ncbi:MAG: DUF6178 family protein [Proteobacteria bacterium]|nr:DUF6178 family protein [Pseudomonadota bacterium]